MLDTDEPEPVDLICHASVMKYLIDNFGPEVDTRPLDGEYFKARGDVCTSPTFFRWVFGFNRKTKISGPDAVVNEYKDMLRKAPES